MENYRLKVFREVVERMSFRKAAEVLHLSQPAVSQQVRALEEEVGARLFDRDGNHIALTEAGRVLVGYANSAAELMNDARVALSALHQLASGELRLGASTTIAQYILPRIFGSFHRQYPQVELSLTSGNTEQIVDHVIVGKVGLGVIEGPAMRRGLVTEAFMRDRMVLIAGAKEAYGRPLRGAVALPLGSLASIPLLLRERGSGSRRVVERALKLAGVPLKTLHTVMQLDSTEAIVSGVEAGLGAGFVSECAIGKELRLGTVRVIRIEGVSIERDFSFIHRAGDEPSTAATSFKRSARFELDR